MTRGCGGNTTLPPYLINRPGGDRQWRPYGRRVRRVEGVRPSSATAAAVVDARTALAVAAAVQTRARGGPETSPASAEASARRASWSAGGVAVEATCPATTATAVVGCRARRAVDGAPSTTSDLRRRRQDDELLERA